MSRRDDLHFPVRRALEKEGWTITHDLYQWALDEQALGRELFLAVSQVVYDERIQPARSAFNAIVERKQIRLIIFDETKEVILQWIQR